MKNPPYEVQVGQGLFWPSGTILFDGDPIQKFQSYQTAKIVCGMLNGAFRLGKLEGSLDTIREHNKKIRAELEVPLVR